MKKIIVVMIMSVGILLSCKNETGKEKFKLSGEIENISDQKVYLEQLYFSQKDPAIVDTAEIKNGKFELSAGAEEEGLYRIRLEKLEHGFIFINDKPLINFKADAKNMSLEGPEFNTPANALLKKLLSGLNKRNEIIFYFFHN